VHSGMSAAYRRRRYQMGVNGGAGADRAGAGANRDSIFPAGEHLEHRSPTARSLFSCRQA